MSKSDFIYDLLLLHSVPKIGARRVRQFMARFKTPQNVFSASLRELMTVPGIERRLAESVKRGGQPEWVEEQLAQAKQVGAEIVHFWHPCFPPLLKKIHDAPLFLFALGKTQVLTRPMLAVVGTRTPTTYGKIVTEKLVPELAKSLVVVSGLARGIDTLAHQKTVLAGGKTVAVLGSGLDRIYPAENTTLAGEIQKNGVLVSEFAMGTKPDAMNFPRRNRIVAGMCAATLVIQAGAKSGALITADLALEEGRDVFAVPGDINLPQNLGNNRLVQQGATPVLEAKNILDEMRVSPPDSLQNLQPAVPLSKQEHTVFSCLGPEPLHIDHIASQVQLPTSQTLGILLSLELKNVVKQLSGKTFVRI